MKKSLKFTAIMAMTLAFTVLTCTPGQAGIWEWLTGQQDSLIPVHEPATTAPAADQDDTPVTTAKPILSNKLVDSVITRPLDAITPDAFKSSPEGEEETRYVTKWVRVPTTRYFPQLERNDSTGWTHVVMKPCTSDSWQLRRVPVTSYRPLLPQVLPEFPLLLRPCDANAPLLGRILNPLLAPGCGGCIIPQATSTDPTPAESGTSPAADKRPTLDPATLVPDSEEAEIRNRPIDEPAVEEEADDDTQADAEEEAADDTEVDPAADGGEASSVLRQPSIDPPAVKEVPGQKELPKEQDAGDATPEKETAAPYKLQPIPDTNRLPQINPAKAPRLIDPRDKTAATPITIPRLTPVSVQASGSSLVRVTAVVPATGTIRKLDASGWVRREK